MGRIRRVEDKKTAIHAVRGTEARNEASENFTRTQVDESLVLAGTSASRLNDGEVTGEVWSASTGVGHLEIGSILHLKGVGTERDDRPDRVAMQN